MWSDKETGWQTDQYWMSFAGQMVGRPAARTAIHQRNRSRVGDKNFIHQQQFTMYVIISRACHTGQPEIFQNSWSSRYVFYFYDFSLALQFIFCFSIGMFYVPSISLSFMIIFGSFLSYREISKHFQGHWIWSDVCTSCNDKKTWKNG